MFITSFPATVTGTISVSSKVPQCRAHLTQDAKTKNILLKGRLGWLGGHRAKMILVTLSTVRAECMVSTCVYRLFVLTKVEEWTLKPSVCVCVSRRRCIRFLAKIEFSLTKHSSLPIYFGRRSKIQVKNLSMRRKTQGGWKKNYPHPKIHNLMSTEYSLNGKI